MAPALTKIGRASGCEVAILGFAQFALRTRWRARCGSPTCTDVSLSIPSGFQRIGSDESMFGPAMIAAVFIEPIALTSLHLQRRIGPKPAWANCCKACKVQAQLSPRRPDNSWFGDTKTILTARGIPFQKFEPLPRERRKQSCVCEP